MTEKTNKKLLKLYIKSNILKNKDLADIFPEGTEEVGRLDLELFRKGVVTEEDNAKIYAQFFNLEYVDLSSININPAVVEMVSAEFASKYAIVPIYIAEGVTYIAISDPFAYSDLKKINSFIKGKYKLMVATRTQIDELQEQVFAKLSTETAIKQFVDQTTQEGESLTSDLDQADVKNAPAVKLVESLINEAIVLNASDVHVEPFEKYVRVRYRIDGILHETSRFDINLFPAVSTRLKIIAGLNIAERRSPQDGRIRLKIKDIYYDFRVSTIPTVYGEKLVVRILDTTAFNFTREQIGFFPEDNKLLDKILSTPHGIILLTGPTGCGKTTTLYSFIKELNQNSTNIITVEDPVEYTIEGVNQVQVNPKANVTFANALRSILRQDPNIIMIGEIRDEETAEIGIRSAITGHLVLSTLHTNDAVGAINRLIDMRVQPYFVADAIVGVIAQRLVRVLCDNCKKEETTNETEMKILGLTKPQKIFHPVGCPACKYTGYKGRTAVSEIFYMNKNIKEMIQRRATTEQIRKQAIKNGMVELVEVGKKKVLMGITSVAELLAITSDNE